MMPRLGMADFQTEVSGSKRESWIHPFSVSQKTLTTSPLADRTHLLVELSCLHSNLLAHLLTS